jgi:hypothetical protein
VVRIQSFLAVVAEREWNRHPRRAGSLRPSGLRARGCPTTPREFESMRASHILRDQEIAKRGDLSL